MKKTISNTLILASILATILVIFNSNLSIFGMNKYFLNSWNYFNFWLQIILYQFLHGWFLHLISNSIFLYIFGNQVELLIWKKKYITFFLLNTIFVSISLLLFSWWNTIWISGFGMAILAFIFLVLKKSKHPDYRWAWVFLILNIWIWFTSNISLVWHLAWAIFGFIFFYIINLTNK